MTVRRLTLLFIAVIVILGGLFCNDALAKNAYVFEITGPEEQAQIARDALERSSWDWASFGDPTTSLTLTPSYPPYWGDTDSGVLRPASYEIPFTFEIAGGTAGVAYWPSGRIYIDSRLYPSLLREVAMHESAHSRVMFEWFDDRPAGATVYECYALNAWCELIGTKGNPDYWYENPVESHAEWFRVTYLPVTLQYYQQPRTWLPAPPNGVKDVEAFHNKWCAQPSPKLPWSDIPSDDEELAAAAVWAYENEIFLGYTNGIFGVHNPMFKRHVALVAERTGLKAPPWQNDYGIATRSEVAAGIPGLTWLEERWNEPVTRSQVLRLMYRAREGLGPEAQTVQRLEKWFVEERVTWRGVTRQPRLTGYAGLLVQLSKEYDVPLWLALGQCWRESQWGTTGLAINHNCLWGVKDVSGKWGRLRGTVSGFADYVSLEECCRAYFRLMDGVYRRYIDAEDWRGLLNKYAPAYENDTEEHYRIVMAIRQEAEARGIIGP